MRLGPELLSCDRAHLVQVTDPNHAPFDAGQFARDFQEFLQAVNRLVPAAGESLADLVTGHFGTDPRAFPSVTVQLEMTEQPNVQLALEVLPGEWRVLGLAGELRHYGGLSLVGLLSGRLGMMAGVTPVEYVEVPVDVERTLPCAQMAVWLGHVDGAPVAVLNVAGSEHGPRQGITVEVMAAERALASTVLAQIRSLMDLHNVYRGKVLSFTHTEYGRFGLTFHRVPRLGRQNVILPQDDLDAIERHTVGIAEHADALKAAARHLKRGLLLYGPPGTGKTLSVMYLCNRMPGRTTLLLTGPGAGALGQAVAIARSMQPSMVVLEDVDLVAMERTLPGMQNNPLLFQLLNEMDGLAEDADVIFVLTTNRVDLLEPALAARPGRIDQAVEIRLPDAESRRRLFGLYLDGIRHEIDDLEPYVARTDGVSAAFIRELVRRALLDVIAAAGAGETSVLRAGDLTRGLDDLLDRSAPLTRAILGAARPDVP